MPRRYHEALGVSAAALRRAGAFDGFVDLDSGFYVDPRLLEQTRVPEFQDAAERFEGHFRDVLRLLKQSRAEGNLFWDHAVRRLCFREVSHTGLGYGKTGTQGSAVGRGLAVGLARTAKELLRAGIDDPRVFELIGLFQEGIGTDRLSDVCVRLVLRDILAYTERVVRRLGAPTTPVTVDGVSGVAPYDGDPRRWFLLLPSAVLTKLPVALDYSDVDMVCRHNEQLRAYVNDKLGPAWRELLRGMTKAERRDFLIRHPDVVRDMLASYAAARGEAYDFGADPDAEFAWHDAARAAVASHPLSLSFAAGRPPDRNDVVSVVEAICRQFSHLVEHGGLWEVLWDDGEKPRAERIAQRLFFGVAESYCRANDLDLSPEANGGSGPVDFKVSRGYAGRVLVEMKRSGNSKLEHGYDQQLGRYKDAEHATDAFYLIVDYGDRSREAIDRIVRRANRAAKQGRPASRVIVVDATPKASASKF